MDILGGIDRNPSPRKGRNRTGTTLGHWHVRLPLSWVSSLTYQGLTLTFLSYLSLRSRTTLTDTKQLPSRRRALSFISFISFLCYLHLLYSILITLMYLRQPSCSSRRASSASSASFSIAFNLEVPLSFHVYSACSSPLFADCLVTLLVTQSLPVSLRLVFHLSRLLFASRFLSPPPPSLLLGRHSHLAATISAMVSCLQSELQP